MTKSCSILKGGKFGEKLKYNVKESDWMQLQIEGVSGGFHEKMTFGQNPDRNKAASHSPTEG